MVKFFDNIWLGLTAGRKLYATWLSLFAGAQFHVNSLWPEGERQRRSLWLSPRPKGRLWPQAVYIKDNEIGFEIPFVKAPARSL